MSLLTRDADRLDGLSLLYWMMMGPHGVSRTVHRVEFSDCRRGLGVKVIGGFREQSGEEFGIYIKRIVSGGLASADGRLRSGDLILDVNNISLIGATNERAVEILRNASLSNHMTLLISRDDQARREFVELMDKYSCGHMSSLPPGSSPPHTCTSKAPPPHTVSKVTDRSESPQVLSPNSSVFSDSLIRLVCVSKASGLGLVIRGGTNRLDGPMVFIQEVLQGGDCHKDGRLQAGDQLVSVNKESLIGVTFEDAKTILSRTRLRPDPTVEIAFIRQRLSSGSSSGSHSPVSGLGVPPGGTGGALEGSGGVTGPGMGHRPVALGQTQTSSPQVLTKIHRNPQTETLPEVNVCQMRVTCTENNTSLVVDEMFKSELDQSEARDQTPDPERPLLDSEEMERLRQEHNEALREIKRLQEQLCESERAQLHLEEELHKLRQEEVEEAQRQTRGMQRDYEEVIRLLETEISELKTNKDQVSGQDLRRSVSVLECQLRKSDSSKKSLESCVTKLLRFIQNVQEFLLENQSPVKTNSAGEECPTGGAGRGWSTAGELALEAEQLSRSVRSVVEGDAPTF